MKKCFNKFICIILSALILSGVMLFSVGCDDETAKKVFWDRKEEVVFTAGWTPASVWGDDDEKAAAAIKQIVDCGFDAFYHNVYNLGDITKPESWFDEYKNDPDKYQRDLAKYPSEIEKYNKIINRFKAGGLKYIPHLENVGMNHIVTGIGSLEGIKSSIYDDACYMVCVYDEPWYEDIDTIASWIPEYEKNYINKPFYVNLFPEYVNAGGLVGGRELGGHTYEEYVSDFCDKVLKKLKGEKWLVVDIYPYKESGLEPTWLNNMSLVAENLKEIYGGHFMMHFQTCSYSTGGNDTDEHRRAVNLADMYQQAWMNMAFGVEAISCYTYARPGLGGNSMHNGDKMSMVNDDGTPTHIYYDVQTVIKAMKEFDEIYLKYKYDGVKTYLANESFNNHDYNPAFDALTTELKSLKDIDSVWCTADTVITQLYDKNQNYAYVAVNFENPKEEITDNLTIKLNDSSSVTVYTFSGDKLVTESVPVVNGVINVSLGAGEGCMLVPN